MRTGRVPRRRLAAIGVVVALAVLVGLATWVLSAQQTGAFYEEDFARDFYKAAYGDDLVQLASLTDYEWSTVSAFGPLPARQTVLEETGVDLFDEDHLKADGLLVFCGGGEVVAVRQVSASGLLFSGLETYTSDVLVGPVEPGSFSTFVEPGAYAVAADCVP